MGIVGRVRKLALAGVIAAFSVVPTVVSGAGAERTPAGTPAARAMVLDGGGATPVARPGTALAARSPLSRSQLRRRLAAEMNRVGGGSGAWVYDVRAQSSRVLYSDSSTRGRLLASNTKLFTTAAFLDRFGADGTLETKVWGRGGRSGRDDQILGGGLALVGDGDPALASPRFARRHSLPVTRVQPLASDVRRAGIRRVKGDLRVDDTIFDRKRSVPQPGITGGPFLSTLSGLSYNSGFGDNGYAKDPAKLAARAFVKALRDAGVRFNGRIKIGDTPRRLRESTPLGKVTSPSAAKLIAQTNTPSDNFFAETLLKRLGAHPGRQGTTKRGVNSAERFAAGVRSGAKLVNGSGLSRTNAASPRNVGRLLVHMAEDDDLDSAWRDSLAVAGRTGTLSDRMRGSAAEGRCQAKTGTIDGVSALSGYCEAGAGLVAFSILMNNVNVDTARRAQDAMAAAIARYR